MSKTDEKNLNGTVNISSDAYGLNNNNNNYTTTTLYYNSPVYDAGAARSKAIEYYGKHPTVKKILSRIDDLAMTGYFVYEYYYSDDKDWNNGIVDYFEKTLCFNTDINLKDKRFFISWDL